MTTLTTDAAIDRFKAPLYTPTEAALFLGLPPSTFRSWARGYRIRRAGRDIVGRPIVTEVAKGAKKDASIPFVGLAEGYALAAIRRAGVPLQRIRPALERLDKEVGIAHALASRSLFTDGAEVLFDYAEMSSRREATAIRDLVVVRNGQRVFNDVVEIYLKRVEFGSDGYAIAVPLLGFARANVVADSRRSFGQPIFMSGAARVGDVLELFQAGEDIDVVSEEFGVPRLELEDAIRHALMA